VNPLKVVIWTCVIVFVVTALVTLLNTTGIWIIPNTEHADSLFNALQLEVAVISVAAFGLYLKNELKPLPKVSKDKTPSEKAPKTLNKVEIPSPVTREIDSDINAINLKNTDLLAIKGESGIAVVKIENLPKGKANYNWRYKESDLSKESTGSGELYEQYGKVNNNGFVEDVGGQLQLKVGPYKLEWSCSSGDCCWVYKQDGISLSIFEFTELDSFRLS